MNTNWNQTFIDFFATNRSFQETRAHSSWLGEKHDILQAAADHFWSYTEYEKPNICVALFNVTPQIRLMIYLTRHNIKITFCSVTKDEMNAAFKKFQSRRNIPQAFEVNDAVLKHFDLMQVHTLSAHQITPVAARISPLIFERTPDEHLV